MTIFSDTMKNSISIYRQMLRRYLQQAEHIIKLNQLNLKNPNLYENEVALYHTGYLIIADVKKNLGNANSTYYFYSGVRNFSKYLKEFLKEFLENYEIENNRVVHRSQKASRALCNLFNY